MTRSGRLLIGLGLLPLPWFLAWVTLGGLLAPNYQPMAEHASALGLIPFWPRLCEQIAALGSGLAFCGFALGLWRVGERRLAAGAGSWLLFGAAMASNGLWTMGSPLHGLYGIGLVNIVAPAFALTEIEPIRRMRGMHLATVCVTAASLLYLWLNLSGYDPAALRGLTQRVFSSIDSAWPALVAWRLLKSSRPGSRTTPVGAEPRLRAPF